jgi:hypothetical protein
MVAPGNPGPGIEGVFIVDWGGRRLRLCADNCADAGESRPIAATAITAARLQRQK